MVIDAVGRNFEIIGEVAKQIAAEIKRTQDQIQWKEMAGMRDKLSHNHSGGTHRNSLENSKETFTQIKMNYQGTARNCR
jgi:uncharacterized protein with HEPN domain